MGMTFQKDLAQVWNHLHQNKLKLNDVLLISAKNPANMLSSKKQM